MTTKKNYTIKDVVDRLDDMNGRLVNVEDWKNGIQIGQAAVEEYKRQEAVDKSGASKVAVYTNLAEVLKYVIPLLVAATALIYAYASRAK